MQENASSIVCTMDKSVSNKIESLIKDGVGSVNAMHTILKYHVKNDLFKDQTSPKTNNRQFYPTKKAVYDRMLKYDYKNKLSKLDQKDLNEHISLWREASPQDKYFFRMHSVSGSSDNEDFFEEHTLLFAHQSTFQITLYEKYGPHGYFLDATYKTSKYMLPLFFVCVRTNVDYQIIFTFMIQDETKMCITEALSYLKKWNPSVQPCFFMTDFDAEEIRSVEEVFGNTFKKVSCLHSYMHDFYFFQFSF